jgi:phage shock protein A
LDVFLLGSLPAILICTRFRGSRFLEQAVCSESNDAARLLEPGFLFLLSQRKVLADPFDDALTPHSRIIQRNMRKFESFFHFKRYYNHKESYARRPRMGILSRFREIMTSNVHALLDRAEDPEKMIDSYMRSLQRDLGQVKAETASVMAEERRAKRALDECQAEIRKLARYAERSVEAGDDEGALKFLQRKSQLASKEAELQAAYESAAANAASMKQIQDKLVSDMSKLEARQAALKGKMAAARMQQKRNSLQSPGGSAGKAFGEMEEKINLAYDEAMALAELRSGSNEDLDRLFEELDKADRGAKREAGQDAAMDADRDAKQDANPEGDQDRGLNPDRSNGASESLNTPEDELAALKRKLTRKE